MSFESTIPGSVFQPSLLERYIARFGDVDTRGMLKAKASPEDIDTLLENALDRGSAVTGPEVDAICPEERMVYDADMLD